MGILDELHSRLVHSPLTRRYQYRALRRLRRLARCPDAYSDLYELAQTTRPAAILDVGSFVGETIARFLDELRVPIYGFEPTPASFRKLQERYADRPLVRVFDVALCDREGTVDFFSNAGAQTNSLLDNDVGNERSWKEFAEHVGKLTVRATTLDAWAAEHLPAGRLIVKADVQGAEGLLLDGGRKTFAERVIAFYTEVQLDAMYTGQCGFGELHRRITDEFSFSLRNVYPCMHDGRGRAVQLDALWVNERLLIPDGEMDA